MAQVITLTPGYTFQTDGTDKLTPAKLNQLGSPVVSLSGTIATADIQGSAVGTAQIADDAVTGAKIADGVISLAHLATADQGSILVRSSSGWLHLAPGTSGKVLTTKGTGADPEWSTVPSVSTVSLSNITAGSPNEHLVTNGSGNVAWEAETAQSMVVVWDQKANGSHGGSAVASPTVTTRDLNQISDPSSIGATVGSNRVNLPAGTYHVTATVPAYAVIDHVAWLYDFTGSATLVAGSTAHSFSSGSQHSSSSNIAGVFTLSTASDLEIRHECHTARATQGLGYAHSLGSHVEIYTQATFVKLS